ncbi:protein PIN-LIKES 3-like isoform X1 [Asparagus officinalis]|nr:protein PIN-LIKES 3-like isoform X1 [Asparagus officinalis]XP_020268131.1 protein PIN-LIKES 3-like isoform X1 [Asparagus officinalis]XP_020268132.1 protein PIN-LIKES 3-like isoform X1 [Asparagus officinalis]
MGFLALFVTASVPVLNVLLVTGVGSFIATNYIGILHEDARKNLNNVVFYVFNPALVSTNLSQTITLDSLVLLWFMPVNVLLTSIFGCVLGWIVIQITKPPRRLRGLILGCCSAGNLGNLFLIIIPAICKEKASPFGAPDVCHTYGLAYASLSMALGAIFLWSCVYNIVRVTANTGEDGANGRSQTPKMDSPEETAKLIPGSYKNYSISVDSSDESELPVSISEESSTKRKVLVCKLTQKLSSVLLAINFKRLFAPSTIGVIVGFVVGLVPLIRKALIGESAPLRVIQDSASLLGNGAIPTVTLIMGGNLVKGLQGSGIHSSLVLGVVVVRYFLLPLIGIVIVKGAIRSGFVHSDPLYQFILLLQYCVPPAMNIGTITQLFGAGESECSVIFLWTYALASISLTLWSTFFMWLVS